MTDTTSPYPSTGIVADPSLSTSPVGDAADNASTIGTERPSAPRTSCKFRIGDIVRGTDFDGTECEMEVFAIQVRINSGIVYEFEGHSPGVVLIRPEDSLEFVRGATPDDGGESKATSAEDARNQRAADALWNDPDFLRSMAQTLEDLRDGVPPRGLITAEDAARLLDVAPKFVRPDPAIPAKKVASACSGCGMDIDRQADGTWWAREFSITLCAPGVPHLPFGAPGIRTLEWTQTGEREWTMAGESPQWVIRQVRGGKFIIFAFQKGRIKRGEHPTLSRLLVHFDSLEGAQATCAALQNALDAVGSKS